MLVVFFGRELLAARGVAQYFVLNATGIAISETIVDFLPNFLIGLIVKLRCIVGFLLNCKDLIFL